VSTPARPVELNHDREAAPGDGSVRVDAAPCGAEVLVDAAAEGTEDGVGTGRAPRRIGPAGGSDLPFRCIRSAGWQTRLLRRRQGEHASRPGPSMSAKRLVPGPRTGVTCLGAFPPGRDCRGETPERSCCSCATEC
jgi:hypothetical protein